LMEKLLDTGVMDRPQFLQFWVFIVGGQILGTNFHIVHHCPLLSRRSRRPSIVNNTLWRMANVEHLFRVKLDMEWWSVIFPHYINITLYRLIFCFSF
jgi:hypothetical protein